MKEEKKQKKTTTGIVSKKNGGKLLAGLFLMFSPLISHAASFDYKLLETFPGVAGMTAKSSYADLPGMVKGLYNFGIWTVGIAAMFMLVIGGFMYMTSAGNTSRVGDAKRVIGDSLLGLLAALGAYLLLYVINPDLTKINLNLMRVDVQGGGGTGGGTPVGASPGTGSCQGLKTQSGIDKQCGDASPQLTALLGCIKQKMPNAVISSISDSNGYTKCVNNYSKPPCFHAQYSCHYGGRNCRGKGSYGVDFATRSAGINPNDLKAAGRACGASFSLDESDHVHISVGNNAGCNCQ